MAECVAEQARQERGGWRERLGIRKGRIPELDLVRGFCLLGMLFHHFTNQVRYLYRYDMFAFQETDLFMLLVRPLFLVGFIGVSGLSSVFSRRNYRRAGRLWIAALILSLAMVPYSYYMGQSFLIIFNVIHVLAFSQTLYALAESACLRGSRDARAEERTFRMVLGFLAIVFLYGGYSLRRLPGDVGPIRGYLQVILGAPYHHAVRMGDYMPIFPYAGIFFVGALLSRTVYHTRTSLLDEDKQAFVARYLKPLTWMGQHSLLVYLIHQPIILAVLYIVLGSP